MATRNASIASRSTRGRKTAAAQGAAQTANDANLSAADKLTQQAGAVQAQGNPNKLPDAPQGTPPAGAVTPAPQTTNDANLIVPHVQRKSQVAALKAANASFKAAINLEIAVACSVFIDAKGTSTAAKKDLYAVYAEAGYDCKAGGEGKDYKTVNRRVNFAAGFYDKMGEELKVAMGEARDEAAIQQLTIHIATKYDFRTMTDVQEVAGMLPAPRTARTGNSGGGNQQPGAGGDQGGGNAGGGNNGGNAGPQGGGSANETQGQSVFQTSATATPLGTPGQQPTESQSGVLAAMQEAGEQRAADSQTRREFDDPTKWVRLNYEGATLVIPTGMKTECLFHLGMKLMEASNAMHGAHTIVPVALTEQFKELAAAH